MSAIALASPAPGAGLPFLSQKFMAARDRAPRGHDATGLALSALLEMGRAARADGKIDEALFLFERLAALPLGGSIEEGSFSLGPSDIASLGDSAPGLLPRVAAAAMAEALETLIVAGRYDIALAVARAKSEADPPWLVVFRWEATAITLSAMGLLPEALVFLASAVAKGPPRSRPLFEQKRAEVLAASGKLEAARALSMSVADSLFSGWEEAPATLDELVVAARAARLLSKLGDDESTRVAARLLSRAA